jgi:glycerol-3-phosphate acyltransferase PlsX
MGGDFAPKNEVAGAIEVFKSLKPGTDLEIILVGHEQKIKKELAAYDLSSVNYSIVHADDVVTMEDDPTEVVKKRKNSSLYKGAELHANGYADAFVSAGNTGAMLSVSTILLGRIKGVSRPAIGTFLPSDSKYPVFVMDVGANVDCKPRFLYEFAVMGSIYMAQTLGVENPKVGLLSVGEEEKKGNEAVRLAHQALIDSNLNFIGNIEGGDIFRGACNVVVCDGFTGNVVLKLAESFPSFLKVKFKEYASKNLLNKLLMLMAMPALKSTFKQFNYEEYGGVPLLGVNGVSIIGHGKSSPKAIKNMILKAMETIQKQVNSKIEIALNPSALKNDSYNIIN